MDSVGAPSYLTNCSFSVPIICVSIVLVVVLMMVDCVSSPPRSRHHSAHPTRSVAASHGFSFNLDNTNNYTPDPRHTDIIEVLQKYFSQNVYFF